MTKINMHRALALVCLTLVVFTVYSLLFQASTNRETLQAQTSGVRRLGSDPRLFRKLAPGRSEGAKASQEDSSLRSE